MRFHWYSICKLRHWAAPFACFSILMCRNGNRCNWTSHLRWVFMALGIKVGINIFLSLSNAYICTSESEIERVWERARERVKVRVWVSGRGYGWLSERVWVRERESMSKWERVWVSVWVRAWPWVSACLRETDTARQTFLFNVCSPYTCH